jgi:hypothetical protein
MEEIKSGLKDSLNKECKKLQAFEDYKAWHNAADSYRKWEKEN